MFRLGIVGLRASMPIRPQPCMTWIHSPLPPSPFHRLSVPPPSQHTSKESLERALLSAVQRTEKRPIRTQPRIPAHFKGTGAPSCKATFLKHMDARVRSWQRAAACESPWRSGCPDVPNFAAVHRVTILSRLGFPRHSCLCGRHTFPQAPNAALFLQRTLDGQGKMQGVRPLAPWAQTCDPTTKYARKERPRRIDVNTSLWGEVQEHSGFVTCEFPARGWAIQTTAQ